MAEMPFMKFFPADYLRDTDILSLSAQGAWMRMICAAWHTTRKGKLSFPLATVARLIHTDEANARLILAEIEDCGVADFQWSADRQAVIITCRRVVRDWQTATENKADISAKRAAAANARWEKERQSKCNASASQMECPLEARNQKLEARIKKPSPHLSPEGETSKQRRTTDHAEAIYLAYPRRVKKPVALKAILKAMKSHAPEFLLERTQTFAAATIGWQERKFIPHPATWFNAEQFNDDPEDWKQASNSGPPKSRELSSSQVGI
jgi:uncharacterized protein YdaU (DUF1376 family)